MEKVIEISQKTLNEYYLKKKISSCLLYAIDMKTTSIGFCYWLNAITYCVSRKINEDYDTASMAEIYTYIASKYNTTVACAEKAMRYAKENSQYRHCWQLSHNLKNYSFLQICTDKILTTMFHEQQS